MLYIIGNGPSRLDFDMEKLEAYGCEWWGCNGIYRDYTPDILFVHDIPVQHQAVVDGCFERGRVAVGDWNPMEIDLWDGLKMGYPNAIHNRSETDTHFVVKGEGNEVIFTSYNIPLGDNIIMYNYDKLKNTFCGISALGYAAYQGHKEITLIGFDALDPEIDNTGNVYEGTKFYKTKYNKDDTVNYIQKMQFVSLLEDELFEDVNVYFRNPLDKNNKVLYNELSYYENSKGVWSLGESSLHDFNKMQ